MQLFMLSPDGVVVNVVPGFWHPDDLLAELKLGKQLLEIWQRPDLSRAAKDQLWRGQQAAHAANSSQETRLRSRWQGFDANNERKRFERDPARDSVQRDATGQVVLGKNGQPQLKTLDQLVHDRLVQRPFRTFAQFDTAVFADYGRVYYDNNKKVDGAGETFMTPRKVAKREAKQAKQRAKEERQRQKRERAAMRRRARATRTGVPQP